MSRLLVMSPQRLRQAGFTLIEILVAMVILSVLATLAYGSIASLRRAFDATRAEEQRIREVEMVIHSITNDWMQLDPEPIRDNLGQRTLPAAVVDPRTLNWFSVTHGGVGASLTVSRGSQLRVNYRLEGERLVRETLPVLHAAEATLPQRRILLDGVKRVAIKCDPGSGVWLNEWPDPATLANPNIASRARPVLVEVTLELEDFGVIHRLIEVSH